MSFVKSLPQSKSVQFAAVFVATYVVFAAVGYTQAVAAERSSQ